jgi:hypothetical protein
MIAYLFGARPRKHRGVHRRRGASPHHVLPRTPHSFATSVFDVRLLLTPVDPWGYA